MESGFNLRVIRSPPPNGKSEKSNKRSGIFDESLASAAARVSRSGSSSKSLFMSQPEGPGRYECPVLPNLSPDGSGSSRRSRRVKRCLWGPPNPDETVKWLDEKIRERKEEEKKEWNFDFEADIPIHDPDLPWEWSPVEDPPHCYITHPSLPSTGRLQREESTFRSHRSESRKKCSRIAAGADRKSGDELIKLPPEIDERPISRLSENPHDLDPNFLPIHPEDVQRVPDLPDLSKEDETHSSCPAINKSSVTDVTGPKKAVSVSDKESAKPSAFQMRTRSMYDLGSKRQPIRVESSSKNRSQKILNEYFPVRRNPSREAKKAVPTDKKASPSKSRRIEAPRSPSKRARVH